MHMNLLHHDVNRNHYLLYIRRCQPYFLTNITKLKLWINASIYEVCHTGLWRIVHQAILSFLVLVLCFQFIHLFLYLYVSFEKENLYFKVGLFLFLISLRLSFFCLVFKKTVYYTKGFFVCIVLTHALLVEIVCYHKDYLIL